MSNPLDGRPTGNFPAKEMLLESKARLSATEEEIAGTLNHLQRLENRRRDILVDINALESPILDLPAEIVCEIFLRCLLHPHVVPRAHDAPILLTHVCRRWREIALSFPGLWTSISVSAVLTHIGPQSEGLLNMLEAWLIRSASNLLSVSVLPALSVYLRGRSPFYMTIRDTAYRWCELEIIRPLEDYPILLRKDDLWDLPQLKKLTLLLPTNTRPRSLQPDALSILTNAPVLCDVRLMGFSPTNLLLPWSQLTTLRADNLFPIECLQSLVASPNLVSATFSFWKEENFFYLPSTAPIARLPHLQSLSLFAADDEDHYTPLFDYFDLPALQSLHLDLPPPPTADAYAPLTALLSRSAILTTLSLDFRGFLPHSALTTLLQSITQAQIHTLSLGMHAGITNGPLTAALRGNADLLPHLMSLTLRERIDRYNEPLFVEGEVVDMLRARWENGKGTLKKFCLVTTQALPRAPNELHPGWSSLAREGMDIEVKSHGAGPFLVVYFNSRAIVNASKGKSTLKPKQE
ncbi:F-box domain-containing protein [Favolaschia claudopus]|uniref:F-box domain-containing protein n=1 Tax=Favolaschia claudopus TaxID=2862362 RepID=A0AAW0B586_9AGAR